MIATLLEKAPKKGSKLDAAKSGFILVAIACCDFVSVPAILMNFDSNNI
jgi:hypothetical protein